MNFITLINIIIPAVGLCVNLYLLINANRIDALPSNIKKDLTRAIEHGRDIQNTLSHTAIDDLVFDEAKKLAEDTRGMQNLARKIHSDLTDVKLYYTIRGTNIFDYYLPDSERPFISIPNLSIVIPTIYSIFNISPYNAILAIAFVISTVELCFKQKGNVTKDEREKQSRQLIMCFEEFDDTLTNTKTIVAGALAAKARGESHADQNPQT